MKGKVVLFSLLCLCGLGLVAQAPASAAVAGPAAKAVVSMPSSWLEREVRHELVMLPYYSVFDHLALPDQGGHGDPLGRSRQTHSEG